MLVMINSVRCVRNCIAKFHKYANYCIIQEYYLCTLVKMSSANWEAEKKRIINLPINEKRELYKTKNYLSLNQLDPWDKYTIKNQTEIDSKKHTLDDLKEFKKFKINSEKNKDLAERVSIFKGDITTLEVDAIVNAANSYLKAGGGVDGAIHRAAGPLLQAECNSLGGCPTGDAKITGGYNLPAKYVIHAVGPQDGSASHLQSCYEKSLSYQSAYNLTSIAFPCISTGVYGFPNRLAAHIALRTVRKFLEDNEHLERVVFCVFLQVDVDIYETLMQMYFPVHEWNYQD